ncbi:hypothetical protein [Lysinibacillus fusiformis]|nr:hypothetical protein QYY55_23050 [Lysinibacillus fusiformis]
MSQFSVRSMLDDFQYNYLLNNFEEEQLKKYNVWIFRKFHLTV